MVAIPARNPGPFFSRNRAAAAALNRAVANGRPLLGAARPGGQIPLNQVRGTVAIPKMLTTQPRVRSNPVRAFGSTMNVPRFGSTPVCGRSAPDSAPDFYPSQSNLHYLEQAKMPYGRQLRGLGLLPDSPAWGDSWAGNDPAVNEASQADDVAGNGIFDGAGAPPTAHAGSGVFESKFAMPGYLFREQPTQPSEIRDTTTGMPLVYQPDAGGSWYDDTRDAYRPFDVETERLYSQNPLTQPKMVPAVRIPRISPVSGVGALEMPASDKLAAYAAWAALGAASVLGVKLLINAFSR